MRKLTPDTAAAASLRKFGRYDVLCGKGMHSARSAVVLGAGGFHHNRGYVPRLFIDKIYLCLGNFAVLHVAINQA